MIPTLITKLNHIINGIKFSASLLISIFGCVQNKFRNNPYVTCPVDSLTLFSIYYSMNNFIFYTWISHISQQYFYFYHRR
jgi:hypothetical protein